eukprot:7945615-Prorocentrum_lima.AAC.1
MSISRSEASRPLEMWNDRIVISYDEIRGLGGQWTDTYDSMKLRRKGHRQLIKGEERFLSKSQLESERRLTEFRMKSKRMMKRFREKRRGRDTEGMRGSMGFVSGSGTH